MAVDPDDEANKIPVPVGQYPLEDGSVLIVEEEGIIAEVKPKDAEEVKEEPAPAPAVDEPVAAATDAESKVNEIKSILIKYEEQSISIEKLQGEVEELQKLKTEFSEFKNELTDVKKEVVEFAEAPAKKPKVQMAKVSLNKSGRLLDKLRNVE